MGTLPTDSRIPMKQTMGRAMSAGLGNGALLLGVLVWPIQRVVTQELMITGGLFVLFWLFAGSASFIFLASRFCKWMELKTALLTAIFTLLTYLFLLHQILPELKQEGSRIIAMYLSAIALGVIVATMNEAIARVTSRRILNFVFFFGLSILIMLFASIFE